MLSKYGILCEVIAEGSFTKVAEHFGYAQSSISASVKSVEEELSTSLIAERPGDPDRNLHQREPRLSAAAHADLPECLSRRIL